VIRICRYFSLLFLLLFCIQFANAQSSFDLNVGFGAAQDKALGSVDINTLNACPAGDTTCASTSSLSGFMLGFGANLMLWNHFGLGGDVQVQPARQNYLTFQQLNSATGQAGDILQSRVTFYDFNGIYQPVSSKKALLQLIGGIGGANVKFYEQVSQSNQVLGNSVQIYVTDHVFIRPQFDVHYVTNFSQFGRNIVTSEMVWIGYSLGRQ